MSTIAESVLAAVRAHAEAAGREDYDSRADDVACGMQPSDWAWPLYPDQDGPDAAYINAVTTREICRASGLDEDAWDDIADVWCEAFMAGYRAAHDERAAQTLEGAEPL